jgi:GNAT superfamily N-acetyltransferase
MAELTRTTPDDPDFLALTAALDAELRAQYGEAQDTYAPLNRLATGSAVVIAREGERAVGCGAFRAHDASRAEVKRMFVAPERRGHAIARAVLGELEAWAVERGITELVLETGTEQHAAMVLYERCGYARVPNFGPYAGMPLSVCFAKQLRG